MFNTYLDFIICFICHLAINKPIIINLGVENRIETICILLFPISIAFLINIK